MEQLAFSHRKSSTFYSPYSGELNNCLSPQTADISCLLHILGCIFLYCLMAGCFLEETNAATMSLHSDILPVSPERHRSPAGFVSARAKSTLQSPDDTNASWAGELNPTKLLQGDPSHLTLMQPHLEDCVTFWVSQCKNMKPLEGVLQRMTNTVTGLKGKT